MMKKMNVFVNTTSLVILTDDHSDFLSTRDRYKFLFDLDITDYKGWAYGLKQAGYATNPRYPELLIRIIEENGLDDFDKSSRQSAVGSRRSADKARIQLQHSKFNIIIILRRKSLKLPAGEGTTGSYLLIMA